jgi:hypothetical protein
VGSRSDIKTIKEVLAEYPDTGCKDGMIKLINEQVIRKPHSYMSTMFDFGFLDKITKAQLQTTT